MKHKEINRIKRLSDYCKARIYSADELVQEELNWLKKEKKLVKLPDGRYDVQGDVDFGCIGLKSLLDIPIRIRKVSGDFRCSENNLTSLEGAPEEVGKNFVCWGNQLLTLKGAPRYVGGGFYCQDNNLTSLEGLPEYIGGDIECSYNRITSLIGAPERVNGGFDCSNSALITLEGAPKYVKKSFMCNDCKLTSLEGAPEYVGGTFGCWGNPVQFTAEEIRKHTKVRGEIWNEGETMP